MISVGDSKSADKSIVLYFDTDGFVYVDLDNLDDFHVPFMELLESDFYQVDEENPGRIRYNVFNETTPSFIEIASDEGIIKVWVDFSNLMMEEDADTIIETIAPFAPTTPNTGLFTKEDEGMKAITMGAAICFVVFAARLSAFILKRVRQTIRVREF